MVVPTAESCWKALHRRGVRLGTLAGSDTGALAAVGLAGLTLHRGPLFHAIVRVSVWEAVRLVRPLGGFPRITAHPTGA